MTQYADPEVTKIKFNKEIQEFSQNEDEYRKMGILCIGIEDYSIRLIFAIPHLKPQPIAFTVNIDFTNWDVEPPSIKLIDPFSGKLLCRNSVPIQFLQWNKESNSLQPILVGSEEPFFCIPGVKEYHQHPAHSGDSWLIHRNKGEGKLSTLINQLYRHSIAQSGNYTFNITINTPQIMIGPDPKKLKL